MRQTELFTTPTAFVTRRRVGRPPWLRPGGALGRRTDPRPWRARTPARAADAPDPRRRCVCGPTAYRPSEPRRHSRAEREPPAWPPTRSGRQAAIPAWNAGRPGPAAPAGRLRPSPVDGPRAHGGARFGVRHAWPTGTACPQRTQRQAGKRHIPTQVSPSHGGTTHRSRHHPLTPADRRFGGEGPRSSDRFPVLLPGAALCRPGYYEYTRAVRKLVKHRQSCNTMAHDTPPHRAETAQKGLDYSDIFSNYMLYLIAYDNFYSA